MKINSDCRVKKGKASREPFFCFNGGDMVPLIGKNRRGHQLLDLLEFKYLGLSSQMRGNSFKVTGTGWGIGLGAPALIRAEGFLR